MTTATGTETEYPYTTAALAAEFQVTQKTLRKRAAAIGIGIDLGGRAGFRYSNTDRQRLIESLRPPARGAAAGRKTGRKKRAVAAAP